MIPNFDPLDCDGISRSPLNGAIAASGNEAMASGSILVFAFAVLIANRVPGWESTTKNYPVLRGRHRQALADLPIQIRLLWRTSNAGCAMNA